MILALVRARSSGGTICPSEAARVLVGTAGDWRRLMPVVRQVAGTLRARGELAVTQGRHEVDPALARGPIRLGCPTTDRFGDGRPDPG